MYPTKVDPSDSWLAECVTAPCKAGVASSSDAATAAPAAAASLEQGSSVANGAKNVTGSGLFERSRILIEGPLCNGGSRDAADADVGASRGEEDELMPRGA